MDELIKSHGKRLFGLCMHLCRDRFEAEELYQETWLKVYLNMDKFDPEREFEPWLTRICVNTYRNRLRKLKRFISHHLLEAEVRHASAFDEARQDALSELHAAVNALPEKYRLVVIMFYFRDMDIKSTAEALSLPQGTVKSRLSKARTLIKEVLENEARI